MYVFASEYINSVLSDQEWGAFIEPDKELETLSNPCEKYKIVPPSGYKANFIPFRTLNPLFDDIAVRMNSLQSTGMNYEDQCSAQYYFDMFNVLHANANNVDRIVEIGVYLGSASCVFAGCLLPMNKTLDLIDVNKCYLRVTYERIRRSFPEAASRVRLYFGDLPSYVKNVLAHSGNTRHLIQHDGSHCFNEVVKDLSSLYFVKDKINGVMIQDTHLRSANINLFTFVDAAVYTVFGFGMKYHEIGVKFPTPTQPALNFSTYFLDNHPEGMYIPFALNNFRYPHPSMKLENFITTREERLAPVTA